MSSLRPTLRDVDPIRPEAGMNIRWGWLIAIWLGTLAGIYFADWFRHV